jgi:hypothetical protein
MNKRLIIFALPCLVTMSIVIWGIGCTSDEEKNALVSTPPSSESTKPGPDSSVIIANQVGLGSHTGSESTFSKAKKAFAEGNYELAEELTKKAILQALNTVKDAKEGTYDEAKKKALPMLEEMWDVRSKINEAQKSDEGDDDEKSFGSERDTVAGSAYEPEPESGPELTLNSSSESDQGSEKATDIFRETWGHNSNYPEGEISNLSTGTEPDEKPEPKEPIEYEPDEPQPEPNEPRGTCCGGYTLAELNAMYFEDEGSFWAFVWACSDLAQCF